MTERELQYSIELLTAMADFATKLKDKLQNHFDVGVKTLDSTEEAPAPVQKKQVIVETEPEVVEDSADEVEDGDEVAMTPEEVTAKYELNDLPVSALKEFLDSYEITYPAKPKKSDLITLVVNGILDGTIEVSDEDDETAATEEAPTGERNHYTGQIEDATDIEGGEEVSDERTAMEYEVESGIREKIESGKLKMSAVKKFLKTYYDGDPEMADLDDREDDDLVNHYVYINLCLVDDYGEIHGMEETYYRDGDAHCCGRELVTMEDSPDLYCEICGSQYDGSVEDE